MSVPFFLIRHVYIYTRLIEKNGTLIVYNLVITRPYPPFMGGCQKFKKQ